MKRGECCLDGLLPPITNYAWIHCFFYVESKLLKLCVAIKMHEKHEDISCMTRPLLRFIKEDQGNNIQINVNDENPVQQGCMHTQNGGWLKEQDRSIRAALECFCCKEAFTLRTDPWLLFLHRKSNIYSVSLTEEVIWQWRISCGYRWALS